MTFWTIAFKRGWVTAERLKIAVKTEQNSHGEITPEEYEIITGVAFVA